MSMPSGGGGPKLTVGDQKRVLRLRSLELRRHGFDRGAAARQLVIEPGWLIASYFALPDEPVAPAGALPRLLPDGDLELVPPGPLQKGLRGTTEPAGPAIPWARADLVIVPALAVGRNGVRLGRGGGSYDRALARLRPGVPVVALLALDSELVEELPWEAHDARVTHAATPSGLEDLRGSRR